MMEGSKQTNGTAPHGDPSQQLPNTARKLRAPTVQEALPYTPLSSIVPFTPGMPEPHFQLTVSHSIPLPHIA